MYMEHLFWLMNNSLMCDAVTQRTAVRVSAAKNPTLLCMFPHFSNIDFWPCFRQFAYRFIDMATERPLNHIQLIRTKKAIGKKV